jgi:hypothetical protein
MIILEGPNGCGKTALSGSLAKALDMPIVKFPKPLTRANVEMNLYTVVHMDQKVILDRHPMISDLVYSPIMFSARSVLPWNPRILERHIVIYCVTDVESAKLGHEYAENDPFYRNEKYIFAAYERLFKRIEHIRYNYQGTKLPELINAINERNGIRERNK